MATAGSLLVGLAITVLLAKVIDVWRNSTVSAYAAIHASFILCSSITIGLVVGLGQRIVLRDWQRDDRGWIWATTIGLVLANTAAQTARWFMFRHCPPGDFAPFCANALSVTLRYGLCGAIGGGIIGGAQWLVLRRQTQRASWWIPINAASWAVGASCGFITYWIAAAHFAMYRIPLAAELDFVGFGTGFPLTVVIVAVLTGLALPRLLEDRGKPDAGSPNSAQVRTPS